MKKKAIIVDVDNTLIDIRHLENLFVHKNMTEDGYIELEKVYDKGIPIDQTIEIVNNFIDNGYKILLVTARRNKPQIRRIMRLFIKDYFNKEDQVELFLAPICNDNDYVVKKKMFEESIKDYYDINLAIDDKDSILNLWKEYNIPGLKVQLV